MWWCSLNVSFHVNTQRPIDSCFIFSHSIISLLTSRPGHESLFVKLFLTALPLTFQIIEQLTFEYHPYQGHYGYPGKRGYIPSNSLHLQTSPCLFYISNVLYSLRPVVFEKLCFTYLSHFCKISPFTLQ